MRVYPRVARALLQTNSAPRRIGACKLVVLHTQRVPGAWSPSGISCRYVFVRAIHVPAGPSASSGALLGTRLARPAQGSSCDSLRGRCSVSAWCTRRRAMFAAWAPAAFLRAPGAVGAGLAPSSPNGARGARRGLPWPPRTRSSVEQRPGPDQARGRHPVGVGRQCLNMSRAARQPGASSAYRRIILVSEVEARCLVLA